MTYRKAAGDKSWKSLLFSLDVHYAITRLQDSLRLDRPSCSWLRRLSDYGVIMGLLRRELFLDCIE
jgi:hypothetical protein